MFDYYDDLFVPDIDGLPETDYAETMTALLGAGFLAGYSLLEDSIVVGTVTCCGFTRLVPIDRDQAGGIFRRTVGLMATLDGVQEADEETCDLVTRDWTDRPRVMRCAAFSAQLPPESEPSDFVLMRKAKPEDLDLMHPGDHVDSNQFRTTH